MVRSALGFLGILLFAGAAAARGSGGTAVADVRLAEEIQNVVARHRPAKGTFGVHVCRARTGEAVFGLDAEVARIPASTMKLATSAAALIELGPGYRFLTRFCIAGRPGDDGRYVGDLLVRGGGDPTIREDSSGGDISALVAEMARAGVGIVQGRLILDAGVFDRVLRHPDWPREQLSRSYCAPVAGLSLNRGCVQVQVRPGAAAGARGIVKLEPALERLTIQNGIVTTAKRSEHRIVLEMDPARARILGRGMVWTGSAGYSAEVSLADPVASFGEVLRARLNRRGSSVGAAVQHPGAADLPKHAWSAAAERATPLLDVLTVANRESQNHYAECVLKTLGREKAGEGSFGAGGAVTAGLVDTLGVDASQFEQVDGSGLSRSNRCSPFFLTRLLSFMFRSANGKRYLETLALGGGADGTLSRRLKDLGGDVRAKTGTLRGVSGLAGFVRSKRGVVFCFAVLVNDPAFPLSRARSLQDEICRALFREG